MRTPFPKVIDSTLMSHFRACGRKAYLESFEHWKPRTHSVHLHAGAAFARGLEVARLAYYRDGQGERDAIASGMHALVTAYGSFECPADSAKSLERMMGAFEYYFSQYPMATDTAKPATLPGNTVGVEFNFAQPLDIAHPETGDPLIYCGRFDMICDYAGALYGEDDKTTSQLGASWGRQWDLRCFDDKTEVLTRSGWRSVARIQNGEHVLQWHNGSLEFVAASDVHSTAYEGDMISLESGKLNQFITPNHRVLLELRRGGQKVVDAASLQHQDLQHKIPLSGNLSGEKLPAAVQRYIVALQADGSLVKSDGIATSGRGHREHMPHPAARFTFTKQRKIDRLREILLEIGAEFSQPSPGYFYISGFSDLQELAMKLLDENREFRPETFDLYDETFLEELEYWDGWASQYYTVSRQNAEFVQTVAHANDWRASVQLKITHTQSYVVCLSQQITCGLGTITIKTVPWKGLVHCLSVPSGFVLTRREGCVSVSGNSQFTAYCFGARRMGIELQGFLVRGVSILKTKYETQQAITYRPAWMVDRWYEQTLRDLQRMIRSWESGEWDYNLDESCNGYGGCQYRKICLTPEETAINWLRTDFERRAWDPLTRTETALEG